MTSKVDANDFDDLRASIDLIAADVAQILSDDVIAALNSRGTIVHAGRGKIQDLIDAATKSVAAYAHTTESNPGPVLNGVSERSFQEALMHVLAAINNNQAIREP